MNDQEKKIITETQNEIKSINKMVEHRQGLIDEDMDKIKHLENVIKMISAKDENPAETCVPPPKSEHDELCFEDLVIKALKNQEHLNKLNQATISERGDSIRWLLISNVALIIALAALLFK